MGTTKKKVQFEIGSNGQDQVANGFNKVDKAAQNMDRSMQAASGGTRKNSQSMIEFGRIIQDAPYGIQGVANNVTRLAETMNVGAPLLMGISLVTSALVVLMGRTKDTKEEVDSLGKSLKAMVELADPTNGIKFLADKKTLEASIKIIDEEIKKIKEVETVRQDALDRRTRQGSKGMAFLTTQLTDSEKQLLEVNKKELESFKGMKIELESRIKVSERLKELGFQQKETTDKIASSTKDIRKEIDLVAESVKLAFTNYKDWMREIKASKVDLSKVLTFEESADQKFKNKLANGLVGVPDIKKPSVGDVLDFTKGEQDLINFVDTITFSLTDTLQSGFSQAWEKIFGEANSLVEQLLSNLANGLMNLASRKAESAIFDFILGLIPGGSAVSGALSVANSGYGGNGTYTPRMQAGNTTTVIKLGDATLLKLVNGVLPQAYNDSVRYREIGAVA